MGLARRAPGRVGPQAKPLFIGEGAVRLVREIEVQLDDVLRCGAGLLENGFEIAEHKRRLLAPVGRIVVGVQPFAEDAGRHQKAAQDRRVRHRIAMLCRQLAVDGTNHQAPPA